MKKIVYLYSEVMGYTLAVVKALVDVHNVEVHIVYWDHKKKTNFKLPELNGVYYYKRSHFNEAALQKLIASINPTLLYVSGRMDKAYLNCALLAKAKGVVTVSGFDAQWTPSIKNFIICFFSSLLYKRYFNYIWVPGKQQHEFAVKMGYRSEYIISNLYSANVDLFEKVNVDAMSKQFVFVGRLANEKGIDILC
jgi:glycosyltransferase involved in cell wall biosynthesis